MRIPIERRNLLPTLGILGTFGAGVLSLWLLVTVVGIPLPADPLRRQLTLTALQTFTTILVPYAVVWFWLGLSPAKLGINGRSFIRSLALGCALYAIALVAFIYCADDPLITRHPARFLKTGNLILLMATMALQAATADIATRGFILLSLNEYTHVVFAILVQNLVWFGGHLYEVRIVSNCLGPAVSAGLFLTLGVLGDMVALRTRNVLGLALAHVLLNLAMVIFIRQM